MRTHTIPVSSIKENNRIRTDLGDIDTLAASIAQYGLIQPLLVSVSTDYADIELVAGGRRLAAIKQLGWDNVDVVIRETLSDVDIAEMELEENVRRKDLAWQERVKAIAKIHSIRSRSALHSQQDWGYEQTGELLGVAKSQVHYALSLAQALSDPAVAKCATPSEALQLLAARKEAEAEAVYLSKRVDIVAPDGTVQQLSVHSQPTLAGFSPSITVRNMDAIAWLNEQPDNSIDCLYTDPPYAIDMDNLQQENVGMDVSTVRETHDVAENTELLEQFIQTAAPKLKPTAYMVLWCDFTWLYWLADNGARMGLRYQRWPLIWVKTHPCQNSAANNNFTKTTECAVVFAREHAIMAKVATTNYWTGSTDKPAHTPTNPFWKPLGLHRWVLSHIATTGSTIVDPFAGSGSIPLAAIGLGYNIVAIELDQKHYLDLCTKLKVL